ncbi:sensor histidine kinase [Lusitaniella coriacea]|uniref:sensor histidine kinase n=1 Tax=Lusitaniella coriacea TaxID=1983105 RepID=UPI003CEEA46E
MLDGTILIVDDTVENLEVASQVLEDAGYEVAMALNGDRALKLAISHPPSLILLDVQMPGMDGFETCQKLKETPETAAIAVIFMTALSDTDSKVKGFNLGAVDYITKPFQEKELLARVRTHLQLWNWSQTLERRVAERTHKLQMALDRLNQSQLQLVQREKMSALGNLVAGIAHEMNNPISFLRGNLQPAENYLKDLLDLIELYQTKYSEPDEEIEDKIDTIDLDYICDDFPKLIASMKLGVERISQVSTSLRTFSRIDRDEKIPFNLHEGIDSTLLILQHRIKANPVRPAIEIVKDYGNIPEVQCFPGQLNQVFMNLIANAIDALEETNSGRSFKEIAARPNRITIQTETQQEQIIIRIEDNGVGFSETTRQLIFEQGFTTKGVGKGTGLGLAIARQIVEDRHKGILDSQSDLGKGTVFVVRIPLKP